MQKAVSILLLAVAIAGVAGCDPSSPTIVFTLPDGFRGVIFITVDEKHGMAWQKTNGIYNLIFPTNCVLAMNSFGPLSDWHKERALYRDGTVIANEGPIGEKSVFFTDLGSESNRTLYFVGTKEERKVLGKSYLGMSPSGATNSAESNSKK